jgi:hypothetical protein
MLAYAAGLLLVAGVALAVLLIERPLSVDEGLRPATPDAVAPPSGVVAAPAAEVSAEIDPETGEMLKTKTELKAAYAERRADLPVEVAKPIDDDIGVIEGAAADLLVALAHEPDNQDLKQMLVATYRNELRLLKKALHLSGAESDEERASVESPATAEPASK